MKTLIETYLSISSAAKGSGTTGEELDSPHGPHGADMAELYAGSLNFHEPGSASMESLDSGSQALEELIGRDLDDPILRLLDDEPSQWSVTVDKKVRYIETKSSYNYTINDSPPTSELTYRGFH